MTNNQKETKMDTEKHLEAFPLPNTESKVGLKAKSLFLKWRQLVVESSVPAQKHRKAQLEHAAAKRAFSEACAEAATKGKDIPPAQRKKMIDRIDKAAAQLAEPWEDETAGIRQAARDAQGEYARHLEEHMPELMDEHRHEAYLVANRLRDIARDLAEWQADQSALSSRFAQLTRFASDPQRVLTITDRIDEKAVQALIASAEVPPVMIPPAHKWEAYMRARDGIEVEIEDLDEAEETAPAGPVPVGKNILYFPGKDK